MLLASLQGEHEPAPALGVDRLADDAARHASRELLAGREKAEARPAQVLIVAERLALAHGDVGALLTRRSQNAEGERVGDDDQQGAGVVGDLRRGGDVLDAAEEARLLDDDGGGLGVDGGAQRRRRRTTAAVVGRHHGRRPQTAGLGGQHLHVLGVHSTCHDDLAARPPPCALASITASVSAVAPSYMEALLTSSPVSSQMAVWYSKMPAADPGCARPDRACTTSGTRRDS